MRAPCRASPSAVRGSLQTATSARSYLRGRQTNLDAVDCRDGSWTGIARRGGRSIKVLIFAHGRIAGRKLSSGAWLASADSVIAYEASAQRGSGGRLSAASAWGLLWELSSLPAVWLSPSTLWRVQRRLHTSSAEEIARAVSHRTRLHRYRAANPGKASTGLVLTGRSSARLLKVGLMDDARHVCGYLPRGVGAEDYASSHFMVADPAGPDILLDNTLPIPFAGDVMPVAVIAAGPRCQLENSRAKRGPSCSGGVTTPTVRERMRVLSTASLSMFTWVTVGRAERAPRTSESVAVASGSASPLAMHRPPADRRGRGGFGRGPTPDSDHARSVFLEMPSRVAATHSLRIWWVRLPGVIGRPYERSPEA